MQILFYGGIGGGDTATKTAKAANNAKTIVEVIRIIRPAGYFLIGFFRFRSNFLEFIESSRSYDAVVVVVARQAATARLDSHNDAQFKHKHS